MKTTTWTTRFFALIAAILAGTGIWMAVAGTAPGTAPNGGTLVTDTNFNQNDNFLNAPSAAQQSSAYSAPRYRTRAS